MHTVKKNGQAPAFRLAGIRESRCAVALLLLFALATVSVAAATSALSRDHAHRIGTALQP